MQTGSYRMSDSIATGMGVGVVSPLGVGQDDLWSEFYSDAPKFAPSDNYDTKFLNAQCNPIDIRKLFGNSRGDPAF